MTLTPEDWIELSNLCGRYCHALDGGDGDLLASLFTEDGELEIPEVLFKGHAELKEMTEGKDRSLMRHVAGSLVLEGTADEATGRSYVAVAEGPRDRRFHIGAYGTYEDVFVKVEGRWLFRRRNILRPHTDDFDD